MRPLSLDDLRTPFLAAQKPPTEFRVGTESEKFGIRWVNGQPQPVGFLGRAGVGEILAALAAQGGYAPYREQPEGDVIALVGGRASITLEPAAQLELSGAPYVSIHETAEEFRRHHEALRTVSAPLGIEWLSVGFHPFATHEQLPRVPKLRYAIMERYLPTRGSRALDMMRRTCTVQANLDYSSPEDAMRKLRVALALQPVATAMFAHSPFIEGHRGPRLSERAHVWLHMDPDRAGLLPFAWEAAAGLDDYIEWALSVPMFLVKRGAKVAEATGHTFRDFIAHGHAGATAEISDWETHINSLFPEARLKKTLEVRGADAQPPALLPAVSALWKGLLYDETALAESERLISGLDHATVQAARPAIAERGLAARLAGKPLQRWAEAVLDVAVAGLARQAERAGHESERCYLDPLRALVEAGRTPAEDLLQRIGPDPTPERIVAITRV